MDYTFCHTQERNGHLTSYCSVIDHFLIDPVLQQSCIAADAIHLGDCLSGHQPIYMTLNLDNTPKPETLTNSSSSSPKPAWFKASENNISSYVTDLHEKINSIHPPEDLLLCRDTHCSDASHIDQCDQYCLDILDAISDCVKDNIPVTGKSGKKVIAGWTEEVKHFQKEAQFYHALWLSSGRQNNTDLHWAMKHSRNQYQYAVRRAKRNEATISNNKFIQSCLSANVDNLLKEVKRHTL